MGLTMDKKRARRQLERALKLARSDAVLPVDWMERTQRVAQFEDKTCLVVLGTALLATATDDAVDALTLKARAGNKAYSARGLAHDVLVPASIDYRFDLRTTGREPLNNQPFFHSDSEYVVAGSFGWSDPHSDRREKMRKDQLPPVA